MFVKSRSGLVQSKNLRRSRDVVKRLLDAQLYPKVCASPSNIVLDCNVIRGNGDACTYSIKYLLLIHVSTKTSKPGPADFRKK